ncbi:MAG: MFS transporter [Deltaproteobacteria bacterium]|nr:MFS transporter [Deltaproteobacteria bacterium]
MHNSFRSIYYGWILVGALSLAETTAWGVLYYAFAVFLVPMQKELGWSRSSMAGAFSLALLLSGVSGVFFGRWIDRYGARVLMTVGSIAATLLVFAWGSVTTLTGFYLVWAGIGVTMAAVLYEPAFAVIAKWFVRYRGRALTILTFVAGFASVIYIPLSGWLIRTQGWRSALSILAVILAVGTIPFHALVLRRRPEDLGLTPDGENPLASEQLRPSSVQAERSIALHDAMRGATFWWLTTAFTMNIIGVLAINVHLVSYLIDHGFEESFATTAMGLVGLMALPGRLIFTPLGDVLPRSLLTALLFLFQTLSLLVLLFVPGKVGVFSFVGLFGVGFGAITPARAALIAEFYGPAAYASINGVLGLFLVSAGALAPVGAAWGHDLGGGYEPVLWTLATISAFGALTIMLAERSVRPAA